MSRKPLTNEQRVLDCMTSGKVGHLAQIVVVTALDNYTRMVANTPDEQLQAELGNSIIHWQSWKKACVEIQEKLNA